VIEQIFFARLDMPESIPDSDLAPAVRTEGMRWVRQGPSRDNASPALSAYRRQRIAAGISFDRGRHPDDRGGDRPASHLVYSDGLATVSVSSKPNRPMRRVRTARPPVRTQALVRRRTTDAGACAGGVGVCLSTVVQGHQVTAVGEVPAQTVEFIAHAVKSSGSAELPAPLIGATRLTALCAVFAPGVRLVRGDAEPAAALPEAGPFEVDVLDVDADPAARVRYGHKIPVLLFAGGIGVSRASGHRGSA